MRYIELNPVRASMVEHPGEYRWSSYHANAQCNADRLIHSHPVYTQLGDSDEKRKACYRELFRDHIDSDTVHQIREALNQELVLGRSYFKEKVEEMSKRQTMPGKPGRPRVEEENANYYVFG